MKKLIMAALAVVAVETYTVPSTAHAADCDLKKGEKVFKRCKACHKLEDGKNGVGPHLAGIVGRDIASVDGFKYSDAMTAYGEANGAWTAELLDTFLTKPKKEVKGTKMAFGGLKKEQQRNDLFCYLESGGS